MLVFTEREMGTGNQHEHIVGLSWKETSTGNTGYSSLIVIVEWLESPQNHGYVEDSARPGTFVEVFVAKTASGHRFVRTYADGKWTNNLLTLPLRKSAA